MNKIFNNNKINSTINNNNNIFMIFLQLHIRKKKEF